MPITAGTFIVGWLAIAGIFPFAGFWSKDEILAKAWATTTTRCGRVGVVAAMLTAFYMTRQVWLVFYGNERWNDDAIACDEARRGRREADARPRAAARVAVDDDDAARRARRARRSSAASSTCRSRTTSSTSSTAGSNRCFAARPNPRSARSASGSRCRRSRSSSRSSASSSGRAVYRNGLRRDGDDPAVERLGAVRQGARERVLLRRRHRAVRQRSGHRVRALPQRRRRPQGASTARSTASARAFQAAGGGLRKLQTGLVRNYALGIVLGAVLLLVFVRRG